MVAGKAGAGNEAFPHRHYVLLGTEFVADRIRNRHGSIRHLLTGLPEMVNHAVGLRGGGCYFRDLVFIFNVQDEHATGGDFHFMVVEVSVPL